MATFKTLKPIVVEGQRSDAWDSFEASPEVMGALIARGYVEPVEEPEQEPQQKAKPRAKRKKT